MRVLPSANYILSFFVTAYLFAVEPIADEANRGAATAAAATYEELFEQVVAFEERLGENYHELFYPSEAESRSQLSEKQKKEVLAAISSQMKLLDSVAGEPAVDFGRLKESEEKGPATLIAEIGPIRRLVTHAQWHAKATWDEDSGGAINNLLNAQAAARHINQEPTLITFLSQIAIERMCMNTLSELSPRMTPDQREQILAGMRDLPQSGGLAGALINEKKYMSGWYKRKLLKALSQWEDEHYGPDGFRFPNDLRLAGVVIMPEKPVQISLHNVRKDITFWLENGKEVHGIRLDRIEFNPKIPNSTPRAWILHDGKTAVIDLRKETIQSRYVPWEVLVSVFGSDREISSFMDELKLRKELIELGMTPETALDQLDRIETFFDEAIHRLDSPIDEYEKWQDEYLASFGENSFGAMLIPAITSVIEHHRGFLTSYDALELGFRLQSGSSDLPPKVDGFIVTKNESGFTLTPEKYAGKENAKRYSMHFGRPPPED